jgi:hypothetical protein
VASVFQRKFVGYSFWVAPGGTIKRRVADKPMAAFKQRVRKLTPRSGGRSLEQVVKHMRDLRIGMEGFFRLAQTPRVWYHRCGPVCRVVWQGATLTGSPPCRLLQVSARCPFGRRSEKKLASSVGL